MPRSWGGLLGGLVLLAGWVGAAQADLVCERSPVVLGEVRGGQQVTASFELHNTGSEPVEVVDVKAGCGCLKPHLGQKVLLPGKSARLLVEISTVTQAEGPNTWKTTIHYRAGGEERQLPLFVTGVVLAEVSIRPATLILHAGQNLGHEFLLTERRPQPLAINTAQTRTSHVRTRLTEPRQNAQGVWERTVHLEVLPSCPDGRHDDLLQLRTTDPTYSELKVPFVVVKRTPERVSAVPASIALAGLKGQPLPARVVRLEAGEEQRVEVEQIETEGPFSCTWASGPGSAATVRILADAARITGDSFQGMIRVRVKKPQSQTVSIPVHCSLR
jgi:hypothetical protein